jgi:2-dehydropantoate 2-reductase
MSSPRIAVLGTGANGSSIAADLIRAGHDVVLIDQWPEHVSAMRRDGLVIEMPEQTLNVPVRAYHLYEVAELKETFDIVFLVFKAYDTRWGAHLIRPYLAPDGLLIPVQNGMTTNAVAEIVGGHRTLGAVIEISSMLMVPGVVERHGNHERSYFAIGGIDAATLGREAEIADLLRHSGKVDIVDDIHAAKWMKLVSNCSTLAPSAILGLPIIATAARPRMREMMIRSGQEAFEVGKEMGLPIRPIFNLEAEDLNDAGIVVERLLSTLLSGFVLPQTTSTVLHDWVKGRRAEVGEINGRVVDERASRSSDAPVNSALRSIAERIERGELSPDPGNEDILVEMLELQAHSPPD